MDNTTKTLKKYLMGGAATGLVMAFGFAGPVYAQDAAVDTAAAETTEEDDAVLGVVTITGIRGSIQNSLNTKKNATSIVEAISAEDIGKLPDLSIADSLARLPGVTAQRVRGRAQQISIRGLGPDFSLALLNGREVVSAGNNRGIEFDQFPSELISQGIVYKTPDATLAATGIAGAVDLRTVRPLDYTDRRINLSAKYVLNDSEQYNPDFDEDGYRLFASLIDQNANGTIGWSLGFTQQSNPTQYMSRELKTNSGQTGLDPNGSGLVIPTDNPRTGVVSREFERTSVAGTLQFEPTDRFQATFDAFYTDTEDQGIFRGVETPVASWANSSPQVTSVTGTSGFADSATYDPVNVFLRTDEEGNTAEIWALGLNASYAVTDSLTLVADISRSTLERSDIDYESYAGTGFGGTGQFDALTFNFDDDGEYSINGTQDFTDPNLVVLTDPGGWGQVGFIKEPEIDDELDQLRFEAQQDLENNFISGITGGVLFTQREKNFDSNENFLRAGPDFVDGELTIPSSSIVGATNSGSIGLDIIAYDTASLINDGTYTLGDAADTEWTVEEEITTFYAKADIDATLGEIPVRGNVGFQYQDVSQESTGTLAGGGEQTLGEDYTYFLPSVNLSFEVANDTFIRAAAAQTVTRPRLDQLAANQNLSINSQVCSDTDGDGIPDTVAGHNPPNQSCYTLNGGNPFLEPYESTSFDLAFERYFGQTGAVSLAFFHKDLSNWVNDVTLITDISRELGLIGAGDLLAANPEIATAGQRIPVNFEEGSITGFELTAQTDFDAWLPENLAGFGAKFSYTYADASLEDSEGTQIEIPGYSEEIWSGDIYYENYGWRARLSARHRGEFLSEIQQFDGSLSGQNALDETILDAQVGYEWFDGPLEGFSVNLEAFNLTDEPFVTDNETALSGVRHPSRHELYGTTYNITVAKKF